MNTTNFMEAQCHVYEPNGIEDDFSERLYKDRLGKNGS